MWKSRLNAVYGNGYSPGKAVQRLVRYRKQAQSEECCRMVRRWDARLDEEEIRQNCKKYGWDESCLNENQMILLQRWSIPPSLGKTCRKRQNR